MRTLTPSKLLMVLFVGLVFLAACSDDDSVSQDSVSQDSVSQDSVSQDSVSQDSVSQDTVVSGEEVEPEPGLILVSSTAITGHAGHLIVIFGPGNGSGICATIDSDPWVMQEASLADRVADSDPCSSPGGDTVFDPGQHAVTAAVFEPGSSTPLISTGALTDVVDGDAHLQLDGGKLSGVGSGDGGRILVSVSEITGQAGKILVVLGQSRAGSFCATIDSDQWALPTPEAMTELPGRDDGPCGEGTPEVTFPAGDITVTAAVVVPGRAEADASTVLLVTVDGDVAVAIDGALLSSP